MAVLLSSQMTFSVNVMFVLLVSLRAEYYDVFTAAELGLLVKFFSQLLLAFLLFCYFLASIVFFAATCRSVDVGLY